MQDNSKDMERLVRDNDESRKWWNLPFDSTTNFSLFGFLLGGFRCDDPRNRTDFTLEDEE
ncbi:MAG: hypothetical protein BMS9Abin23_0591 [Thermodesulfobacteriota bacterium]|nr:MAG: hypothetical protein BMS9Abin23_0591 [Thermodesulfobacteriota bacterium]